MPCYLLHKIQLDVLRISGKLANIWILDFRQDCLGVLLEDELVSAHCSNIIHGYFGSWNFLSGDNGWCYSTHLSHHINDIHTIQCLCIMVNVISNQMKQRISCELVIVSTLCNSCIFIVQPRLRIGRAEAETEEEIYEIPMTILVVSVTDMPTCRGERKPLGQVWRFRCLR